MNSPPKAPPESLPQSLVAEAAVIVDSSAHAQSDDFSSVWRCFVSTFVTIFLAELGDKTQVATLLMSAQSHEPWVVFGGCSSGVGEHKFGGRAVGAVVGEVSDAEDA